MQNKWKKKIGGLIASFAVGAMLLAGCTDSRAETSNGALGGSSIPVASTAVSRNLSEARNTPVVRAAEAVGPAVVGITNKTLVRDWFNNVIQQDGFGSGVIFRRDGYIVTNNHVIDGAQEIMVSLADGRTLKGKVVGADAPTDIAVIKVDADDLPTAQFGDSDDIVVGEPAIAIGNPMGQEFQGSVTAGVISALNRTLDIQERRVKLLQTDAAINPGNSGGALVNADGLVIGINSIKIAREDVEGMCFAIPINTVREIVDQLMTTGRVIRPYLGVGVFDKQTAARAGYQLNVDAGVYVQNVTLDGPAGKAGLQRGDIIVEIGGEKTNTVGDLRAAIASHQVGDVVSVKIIRDGETITLDARLEAIPEQ